MIYNFILVPAKLSCHKGPLTSGLIFILFTFLNIYSAFQKDIVKFLPFLTLYIMSALVIYPSRPKITGLLLNSLFQISWLYCFIPIVGFNFTVLGFIFFLYHIPILILTGLKINLRLLLLSLSSLGGILIAMLLVLLPFPYSLLAGIILHFCTYFIFLIPLDGRFKMGVIN